MIMKTVPHVKTWAQYTTLKNKSTINTHDQIFQSRAEQIDIRSAILKPTKPTQWR